MDIKINAHKHTELRNLSPATSDQRQATIEKFYYINGEKNKK